MVNISVENYKNTVVHNVTAGNRKMLWIKINNAQDGLGKKNISDLVSKEIYVISSINNPAKEQISKYNRSEK